MVGEPIAAEEIKPDQGCDEQRRTREPPYRNQRRERHLRGQKDGEQAAAGDESLGQQGNVKNVGKIRFPADARHLAKRAQEEKYAPDRPYQRYDVGVAFFREPGAQTKRHG